MGLTASELVKLFDVFSKLHVLTHSRRMIHQESSSPYSAHVHLRRETRKGAQTKTQTHRHRHRRRHRHRHTDTQTHTHTHTHTHTQGYQPNGLPVLGGSSFATDSGKSPVILAAPAPPPPPPPAAVLLFAAGLPVMPVRTSLSTA
jgi:hypothetical protein